MSSVHRVVDYPEFAESINKSKRRKLVEYIRKERTYKRVPERAIQVIPLYGWFEDNNPRTVGKLERLSKSKILCL